LAITDAQDTNDGMLTIKNIQNIAGGAGSDTIYGNTDNNILSGGYGSDTLSGRGGNNTLIGGLNGFELTLGAIVVGTVYSFAIEGQTINYTAQSGDTKADVLDALEDTFKANGSITTSYIVNDGDKLYVETNDGVGTLALNNITSVTESFIDIADYSINPYNGIKVDLSLANGQVYDNGNGGSDTLVGIEQLKGSNYADTFIGSNGNDTIYGGAGNDTFTGGTGNDTFYGETGDDLFISSYNDGNNTYYGGTTDEVNGDTIDYSGITDSEYKVIGDLSNSTISVYNSDATPVLQKTDTINSIENLTGGAGNDTLRGNTSKNTLKGGTGSDTIYASEGGDRLFGEAGDDRFVFENGVDGSSVVIDGGTTSQTNGDTIDYSALTDGVALRLMGTSYSGVTVGVTTNHHTIRNINNILGSQGDDTIEGDSGNNILDGHDGLDTVSFENSGAKVVVNIGAEVTLNSITYTTNQASGTTIGTDTITNFENIVAGSGDDTLIGSSVLNTIYGGIGKDFIYGGEGDDKLYGEDGNDTITGGIGNDTIDGGEGSDTVSYFDADKAIVNLRGATYGSGTVTYGVDDYTDRLYSIENVLGSAGNDTIQGNETNNTLDGVGGTNTVSYSGAASGVVVDLGLQGQTQDTVGDGVDYLANFADLIGSSQADTLKGDTNTNMINGGAGDDTIYGIGGSNYLYGSTGDDTVYGKVSGSDFVDGGTGNNKIDYSNLDSANFIVADLSQTTTYNDENGASQTVSSITVTGGSADYIKNINVVEGSQGNDIITGNSDGNTLIGGEGDDTLNGYAGSNLLIGGNGTNGDWADYGNRQQIKLDLSTGLATVDSNSSDTFEPTDDIDTLIGIENIYGSNLDTYADDTITGNDYNNTIFGQKGEDTIDGGRGSDYLDGGIGNDTVSYASVSGVSGISVNIGNADVVIDSVTYSANSGIRNSNTSEVYNFENIQGSINDDVLIGSTTANEIYGGTGNDTIYGNQGDNYLFGDAGADKFIMGGFFGNGTDYINHVDGGSGADILDYSKVTTGAISVTLDGEEEVKVSIYSDNARSSSITNTYDLVKNIRNVVGTSGNDSIKGDGSANVLDGGAGDDILDGGAGDDSLIGGAGDDTLISVSGNNTLDGGTHGSGGDWVYYNQKLVALNLNMSNTDVNGYSTANFGLESDSLINIENIRGTIQADFIGGNDQNNTLDGYMGDGNTLVGSGGDDVLLGSTNGNDTFKAGILQANGTVLDGNDGNDTIDGKFGTNNTVDYGAYASSRTISIDMGVLNGTDYSTVTVSDGTTDKIKNIQNITGGAGADLIIGDAQNNILSGGAGNDTIKGVDGSNQLLGGAGDDTIYSGIGDDVINGEADGDTVNFEDASGAITVNLATTTAQAIGGGMGSDTITNVENVIGSSHDDSITGNSSVNTLIGAEGDDKFVATNGSDTYYGGTFDGTTHTVASGEYNRVDYANVAKVYVDLSDTSTDANGNAYAQAIKSNSLLNDGFAANIESTDNLYGIINIKGSSSYDTLIGDSQGNKLEGMAGDDILEGKGGVDVLEGGAGNDTFVATTYNDGADDIDGGADSDTLDYSSLGASNAITITLAGADTYATVTVTSGDNDKVKNIENVIGTAGNDVISGNSDVNTLIGGLGDDRIYGAGGDDTIDGGDGFDTVDYSSSSDAVNVDLGITSTTQLISASQGNDRLIDIEKVIGSSHADTFKTNYAANNTFDGGVADSEGGDTVDYSSLVVSDAAIHKIVTTDFATVSVNSDGVATTDTFIGIENIIGSDGNDTITGNSLDNTIEGGLGSDTLSGGSGDDYIDGGAGSNTVSYSYVSSLNGVVVDLKDETGIVATGDEDVLVSIANVIGTANADTIKMASAVGTLEGIANNIDGGNGVDTVSYEYYTAGLTINLGAGAVATGDNDVLTLIENAIGGSGDDTFISNTTVSNRLDGGDGSDTADYSHLTDSANKIEVVLNGSSLVSVTIAGLADDTIKNIENVTGGAGDDTITGDSNNNTLSGSAGDDTIKGVSGSNSLYGGADDDMIYSGTGSDYIDGGTGTNTVNYSEAIAAVNVDLGLETAQNIGGGMGSDTLVNIQNVIGSNFDDTFKSHLSRNNHFDGYGNGVAGNTVDYSAITVDNAAQDFVRIDLSADSGTIFIDGAQSAVDTYTLIHNITGTDGHDTIVGDELNNTLRGADGNDTLGGGAGNDYLDGGTGNNTVTYAYSASSIEVDFKIGLGYVSAGDQDTLVNIQNAIGGSSGDVFKMAIGDIANTVDGNNSSGNLVSYEYYTAGVTVDLGTTSAQTVVTGSSDIDTLINIQNIKGGEGNDSFRTDFTVSNQFDGNAGNNTMDYSNANASQKIVVTLDGANFRDVTIGTGAVVDSIKNIQNVYGGAGNDTIIGDGNSNILDGGSGDDLIRGIAGLNDLRGGAGADTIYGGTGNDIMDGGADSDTIYANAGDNIIYGGDAGDTVISGTGNDTIYGGYVDGSSVHQDTSLQDWVSFDSALANVTVDLNSATVGTFAGATGYAQSAATGLDSLFGIENIIASANDDNITLNDTSVNTVYGGAGSDTVKVATTSYTGGNTVDGFGVSGVEGSSDSDSMDYSELDNTQNITVDLNTIDVNGYATVTFAGGSGISDDKLKNIENITGTDGNDILYGKSGQNNTLIGGLGDDTLMGRSGDNYLDGGDGTTNNTVSYAYVGSSSRVVVNLDEQTANVVGSGYSDVIRNIQNVIGGDGDDTITGSSLVNTLQGGIGADTFVMKGSANDTIYGGLSSGVDTNGQDTVDYSGYSNKVYVNIDANSATVDIDNDGFDGSDKIDSINGIENVIGTSQSDTIYSGSGVNTIFAGGGADSIYAGSGIDVIYAQSGDDIVYMNVDGNTTGNHVDGGEGTDTVVYTGLTDGIIVNLQDGTTVDVTVGGSVDHNITSIENITGTNQADIITGSESKNVFVGMGGSDTITGIAGNNVMYGGTMERNSASTDVDTIYGGTGNDTIYGAAGADDLRGGLGDDTIYAGAGDDIVRSGIGEDTLYGEAGNDTFVFEAADNMTNLVFGGDETTDNGSLDMVDYRQAIKGLVIDLDGKTNIQSADEAYYDASVIGTYNYNGFAYSADQGFNMLYGIEQVRGSDLEGDTIRGNGADNSIWGHGGDDTIYGVSGSNYLNGGSGADTLFAGVGSDLMIGESGNDLFKTYYNASGADEAAKFGASNTMYGGTWDGVTAIESGSDTVDYSAITDSTYNIFADLSDDTDNIEIRTNTTVHKTDSTVNINNIIGTAGDDTFRGNANANILNGSTGSNTAIYTYTALIAGINANLNAGEVEKTVAGGTVTDTLVNIQNLVGSDYDDSFVTKLNEANIIDGGTQGSGGDTIDYSTNGATKIVLNLNTAHLVGDNAVAYNANDGYATVTVSGASAANDKIKDIENIKGSGGADTIYGNSSANTIYGMGGNDTIYGIGGANYIDGGAGNDLIYSGSGADTLFGGVGNDTFRGESVADFSGDEIDGGSETDGFSITGRGSDTVDYSLIDTTGFTQGISVTLDDDTAVTVSINSGNEHTIVNIENIIGTSHNDSIVGDSGDNTLVGGAGTDTIRGTSGNNVIYGDTTDGGVDSVSNNDVIYAGTGDDKIYAGGGNDSVYTALGSDTVYGGDGNDTIFGGVGSNKIYGGNYIVATQTHTDSGNDTVSYENIAGSGIIARLNSNLAIVSATGNADVLFGMENVIGTAMADEIVGNVNEANILIGGAGNDTINGLSGNNDLQGGADNDTIISGSGNNAIDGGTGSDTVDYSYLTGADFGDDTDDVAYYENGVYYSGVKVDLTDSNAQRIHVNYGTDTITNIENVIGSTKNDYIVGNDENNILDGKGGNDYFVLGQGTDTILGDTGTDTITFTETGRTAGVIVDLSKNQTYGSLDTYRVINDGFTNAKYLDSVENVIGTSLDDTIYGNTDSNSLVGGAGNDTLKGSLGANVLDGGANEDWAYFDDIVVSGINVTLDTDAISGNGSTGTATLTGYTNTLIGIEHIKATALADIIRGDHNDNSILSGGGNDTMYSSGGSEYIDGGEGADTVIYNVSGIGSRVTIDLSVTQDDLDDSTWAVQEDGFGNKERLYNVENIEGTDNADFIKGNGQNNTLWGGAGDDTLYGVSANNILVGGAGSDTFRGGIGDNVIYGDSYATLGGTGTEGAFEIANSRDLIDFSDSGVPVTLNLSDSTSINYINETSLTLDARTSIGYGKNTIYNVEDVLGGSGADTLIGSSANNVIDGGIGNDVIFGFGGTNTLIGGAGNDTILGLLGGDAIYGGTYDGVTASNSGLDLVDYSHITDTRAVNIDLSLGSVTQIGTPANADTLTHIENAKGTKNDDTLKGDNAFDVVNSLFGYDGDDSFVVSKGSDYIDGGDGFNTMDYSSVDFGDGGNRVIVDLGLSKALDNGYHLDPSGTDTVVEDTLLNIQKVIGTGGDDSLYGSSYANIFEGGAGNDYIDGREGADTIYGTSGNNKLFGSAGDDTVYGGTGNDTLSGGADNDILDGTLGGNNTYIGGTGDDTITGGAGIDTLYYAASESGITVTLQPSGTDGTIVSSTDGTDSLKTHFEVLIATNYRDVVDLRLASANSTILAYGGNDTIYSSSGYGDTIYGGDANDVIYANGGNNEYFGGNATLDGDGNITGHTSSGDDTVNYSLATAGINVDLSVTADGSTYNVTDNGFGGQDKLYGITRITGSDYDDIIKGSSSWNALYAGGGDDWIIATNGGDTIYGGTHNVSGDWLSFEDIATSIDATMTAGSITGGLGTTTIFEIENLFGSEQDDILRGDSNNNTLHGNIGNDTIYGIGGANFLVGGQGDDTLIGGSGIDRYDGGDEDAGVGYTGTTTHGTNTISFYDTTTARVVVNLLTEEVTDDGFGNTETYVKNINNIIGTLDYNDTLTGDNSKNIIYGYGGHDVIYGTGGENTLYGGTGNDTVYASTDAKTVAVGDRGDVVYGGQGIDTLVGSFNGAFLIGGDSNGEDLEGDWIDYSSISLNNGYGIYSVLSATSTFTDADGDRAYLDGSYSKVNQLDTDGSVLTTSFDYLSQIENIKGTSGIDTLGGSHGVNNSILAGAGDDTIFLSTGTDYIDGGDGTGDWISLENMAGAISNFDLANNNAGDSKVYNIENVLDFNGDRGQTVWGSNGDNTFIMYAGNDHVLGRQGNDVYDLGIGDDRAANNYGVDTLIGGAGQDTIDMWNNLGANQGARVIFDSITAADYNSLATGIGTLTLSNQTVVTSSITVEGLATLSDGSYNFYRITDGRGSYDYLYQDGTNPDFEQFLMTNYADIFVGSSNNDTVYGYGANDTIWAMGGNDIVYGGDSADTIFGVSGNNRLDGGNDDDLIFGGTGNDSIWGQNGNDTIYAKAGNNSIYGGENDDIIYAGTGLDIIDGGNGEDTLRFDGADTRVVVNLGSDTLSYDSTTIASNRFINSWLSGGSEQTGTVTNVENVDGTDYNDTIRGNDEINSIRAGAGDDYIFGSYNNDYINGGTHTNGDWLNYSLITTYNGINIDLEYQRNAVFKTEAAGDDHNQVLDSIEHIIGTAQNDLIQGTLSFGNTLRGGDGADTIKGVGGSNYLYGDGGDDTIFSGTGNDNIDGGSGTNTVSYVEFSANVKVNIDSSTHDSIASMRGVSGSMTDTLVSIQNVTTGSGADTIWGSSATNTINSGAGNDTIYTIGGDDNYVYAGSAADVVYGADGRDTIYGEDGNDTIIASGSNDYIDGSGDIDIVNYSASTQGLNVTLADSGALTTITLGASNGISAGGFTDSLYNIEGLVGSSTATNILIGNNMNNSLIGGANTDTIKGISGNNYLNGGSGADTIYAGTGSDSIIGGSDDNNWLYYDEVGGANVNVNLRSEIATYGASTDTIVQIRHLHMGNGTNTVQGNSYANSFIGGSGTDTLSYSGAASGVTVNVTSDGAGTASGDGADEFTGFEHYTLSGNADTINLSGVYGSTINGGSGIDTASYTNVATGLTVTVNNGNTSATVYDGSSTDTLQSVEKIIGGDGNDTFIVSNVTGINTLDGDGGVNTLQLSGDIDLSSVVLLNFNDITVADGDTLTINATDLDDKTMNITLNGTGSLVIVATALASDHDFDNITVTRAGSGNVTLQVDSSVNLIGHDINGTNNIIDIVKVNSGTATLSEAQVTAGTVVVNGAGSAVVEVSSSSSTDFGTVLQLTTATNETVKFTANSTFSGDFGNSNIVVNSGVTLTTTMDKLSGKTSVLSGAGNITITDVNISALEANAVAGAISGTLTATITTGAVTTTLNAIGNVSASDVITFTTNDTSVDASDLVDLNAKVDTFGVNSITTITEAYNTANVTTEVVDALNITGNTEAVTITGGAISAANLNTIANATSGAVTATITSGAVTTTLNAITNVDTDDVITFTTTDTTGVDASDLVALSTKVDNLTVSSITGITEAYNTASLTTVITNAIALLDGNETISITGGAISASDANTILNATSGVVTATVTADTASNLDTALVNATSTDALTLTLTDTTLANVDSLIALDGKTSVAVNASSVTTVTDTYADLNTVYTSAGISGLGNEAVTISDTQSASNVNNILNRTSGVVTATVTAATASSLNSALANATSSDALTLTLTDTTLTSVDDLNALDGKTSVAVNASTVTTMTDSYADLHTVYTSVGISGLGNENVTVSDTSISASNLSTLNTHTSGTINATNVTNIDGTLTEVNTLYGETGFSNLTNKTVNLSTSGSFDMTNFSNIDSGEISTLNFAGGADTINFTDKSSFDSWVSKFSTVSGGASTDELSFSSAVTDDLDFSQLSSFETLSFDSGDDTITFGSDEFNAGIRTLNLGDGTNVANLNADTSSQVDVNGGSGNDEFVLDFSRINDGDYQLDGVSGSDTVKANGSWSLSGDMNFAVSTAFDNIDRIDLSSLTLSGDDDQEFMFSGSLVNNWTNNDSTGGSLSLKLTSDQLENVGYTDDSGIYHDGVSAGTSYNLENGATLVIEAI